jgi:4a-hydroxytetrahydrobiopterin dehydratase
MSQLKLDKCQTCPTDAPRVSDADAVELMRQIPSWQQVEREGMLRLERTFKFKDFLQGLAFTNRVGALAEEQDHHPAILTEWGKVTVAWWTHSIGGLHRNDFVMAAKTDGLYEAG